MLPVGYLLYQHRSNLGLPLVQIAEVFSNFSHFLRRSITFPFPIKATLSLIVEHPIPPARRESQCRAVNDQRQLSFAETREFRHPKPVYRSRDFSSTSSARRAARAWAYRRGGSPIQRSQTL